MFLKRLLDFVYPTRCVSCRKTGLLLCDECRSRLELLEKLSCVVCGRAAVGGFTHPGCANRNTPERMLAGFAYGHRFQRDPARGGGGAPPKAVARRLVQALKYRRLQPLSNLMVELLINELEDLGVEFGSEALVIPIPLSFWRRGARGFNQAELLGKTLANRLGLSFRRDLLHRLKDSPSQVSLSRPERSANVRGVFALKETLNGEDVLLVDDVITTGATVREAARTLKKGGAGQVWVLAFAQD